MDSPATPFAQLLPYGFHCATMVREAHLQLLHNKDPRAYHSTADGLINLAVETARDFNGELGWTFGTSDKDGFALERPDIVIGLQDDPQASEIESVHFRIYVKASSSLVMFQALQEEPELEIRIPTTGEWRLVPGGTSFAADLDTVDIKLGGDKVFTYKSLLMSDVDTITRFNKQVDKKLGVDRGYGQPVGFVPGAGTRVFFSHDVAMAIPTIGVGTLGTHHRGFDLLTGELYAVKDRVVLDDNQRASLLKDLDVWLTLQDIPAVLKMVKMFCECGSDPATCARGHEHIYLATPSHLCSLGALSRVKLRRMTESQFRYFFLRLLNATHAMHECNVMHRALSMGNILIATLSPPTPTICGLRNAAMKETDNDCSLGPREYWVPEVWSCAEAPAGSSTTTMTTTTTYGREIDLWAWAVIMSTTLVVLVDPLNTHATTTTDPEAQKTEALEWLGVSNWGRANVEVNKDLVEALCMRLRELSRHTDNCHFQLVDQAVAMLTKIFKFSPAERMTVRQTVGHPY